MKKFYSLSALFLMVSIAAFSATLTVGWDPSPISQGVTGYRLYSLIGTNQTLLSNVTSTNAPITLPDGMYKLAVTATNIIGESDLSLPLYVFVSGTNVVAITVRPGAPVNIQLR